MFPIAKMWIQFICIRITLALHVSNVNTFRAILLYGILQKKQICIGQWIHQSMKHCVSSQKDGIFLPHLVMALCNSTDVPMEENEQFIHPTTSLIGGSIYTHCYTLKSRHGVVQTPPKPKQ
ncbi:hypothetical protein V6Z11_A12G109800 [Gossypium hirsutum]